MKAEGGLPNSLWDTYSAFANCYGGVIILGVKEDKDGNWHTTGLKNVAKLKKDFWDTLNNRKKVSINLLKDGDVETFSVAGTDDVIMVIWVPSAKREQKPVYINDDLFGGTFRRNWEGDYHCTRLQVKTMLRDQAEETMDMEVLDEAEMEALNQDSIRGYRNSHKSFKPGHPFERLDDNEYLRVIGAAGLSKEDKRLHPTAAGMLMFGNEYDIVRHFPEYFLDYRENPDTVVRWTDRLQSSSGEWSGNLFDFYFRVYNKMIKDIKVPFKMQGGFRIDDTPVHRALREALANCIINTDFYGKSDPRNKSLMKMFNLIDIGEHAGSGVPNIFNVWEDEGWEEPVIKESFDPDRTSLILKFIKKQAIKTSGKKQAVKTSEKKQAAKTGKNIKEIRLYLQKCETAKTSDIAELLGLSMARTRVILSEMNDVEALGTNRTRRYRLREKGE
ncbi:MAG TPA: AAA family ATPase [Lachnospiraceae bacterium]|nr:AAA family ATPase [Lachnospiraceae bacterium]